MSNRILEKNPTQVLLAAVEAFLKKHDMPASNLGKGAVNDVAFIYRLRRGSEPMYKQRQRVWKFMKDYRP